MQTECPICHNWSKEKYILRAQKESERIKFWLPYCENYEEACRSVCDNNPRIDKQWKEIFPDPAAYRKMVLAQRKAELAATTTNTTQEAIALLERWVAPGDPDETLISDTYHFLNNDATASVR